MNEVQQDGFVDGFSPRFNEIRKRIEDCNCILDTKRESFFGLKDDSNDAIKREPLCFSDDMLMTLGYMNYFLSKVESFLRMF